ncbi:MAG: hypothetical protein LAT50_20360 [Ectothiorhodospiraceae bacterium]|nr:hypothetical protein [Ectothiorhodospiraceae bacterium]
MAVRPFPVSRLGDEIYESQVRPQVEEGNDGKIVAINLETGNFEVDSSEIAAGDRSLTARDCPYVVSVLSIPAIAILDSKPIYPVQLEVGWTLNPAS